MDKLQTFEAKLFYKVYMLKKTNLLDDEQSGRIKDMIILKDERVEGAMKEYLEDMDEWKLLKRFQTCSNDDSSPRSPFLSEKCFSQKSSSKYKGKRPQQIQLPLKNFTINLRKNTIDTLTCTARSTHVHKFNRFVQDNHESD